MKWSMEVVLVSLEINRDELFPLVFMSFSMTSKFAVDYNLLEFFLNEFYRICRICVFEPATFCVINQDGTTEPGRHR